MQSIEFTAKSELEAKAIAAEKLSVSPEEVEITVLETVKGLFGKSSVRVKATAKSSPAAEAPKKAEKPEKKETKRAPKAKAVVEEPVVEDEVAEVEVVEEKPKAKAEKPARGKAKAAAPAKEESDEEAAEDVAATQEDADALLAHLRGWLAAGNLEVSAEVGEISGKYVTLTIDGRDLGHLVGKHGEVLNALQYLMNISAGRKLGNGVRCTLDGDGYRRRREEKLTALATKIALQVKERGEEAVLDALPAFERRIVHKALGEIEGVTTYSEGEEPNRRVVIAPAE
jgi:spoIIIJ-associated protein